MESMTPFGFKTTLGRINDDRIFIWVWSIPLMMKRVSQASSPLSTVILPHTHMELNAALRIPELLNPDRTQHCMLSIFTVQEELMGLVQRDERARVLIALYAKPWAPTTESSSHFVLMIRGNGWGNRKTWGRFESHTHKHYIRSPESNM